MRRLRPRNEVEERGEVLLEAIGKMYAHWQRLFPDVDNPDNPISAPGYEIVSSRVFVTDRAADGRQRIDFQFKLKPMPYAHTVEADWGVSPTACKAIHRDLREALRRWGWGFPPPEEEIENCWLALLRGVKEPCDLSGHVMTVTAHLARFGVGEYACSTLLQGEGDCEVLAEATPAIVVRRP